MRCEPNYLVDGQGCDSTVVIRIFASCGNMIEQRIHVRHNEIFAGRQLFEQVSGL